jgi:hypothetical protein
MAFGRVFALFDAMTAYLILTNPWGSGDESDAPAGAAPTLSGATNVVADDDAGGMAALAPAMPFKHITADQVPDDIRDLIETR